MRYLQVLFIVILLSLFSSYSFGQRVMGTVIVGFNTTNVQGDDVYGFHKIGVNAGVAAYVPFSEKWSFSLEAAYSQKGSNHNKGARGMDYQKEHDYNQYKLVLNYVEVPLLVHFEDKTSFKFGTGFSYGRLVEVKEWEDDVRIATTNLTDGPYALNDYCWVVDVQVPVYRQLKFNARYSFSMVSIRERYYYNAEMSRDQFNQVLSFRVFWVFNEKISRSKLRR